MLITKAASAVFFVPRSLTDDDRSVISCPVTFSVATCGLPPKSSYLHARNATLIFLKSNLRIIHVAGVFLPSSPIPCDRWTTWTEAQNAEFPSVNGIHELILTRWDLSYGQGTCSSSVRKYSQTRLTSNLLKGGHLWAMLTKNPLLEV